MELESRQKQIIEEFEKLPDWEARYRHLINIGKGLPELPDSKKLEDFRVKGCVSQVWLHARLDDQGHIIFEADSDAMIVRGLVALILRIYSDASPREIIASPPEFIKALGFAQNLSPSRANGLHSMIKQVKYYATAYQALLDRHPSPNG